MALKSEKRISIIGCGWLGFPLAQRLVGSGYVVRGSTTSTDKLEQLSERDIIPHQIVVGDEFTGDIASFFDCDILIINIPPGRKNPEVCKEHPKQIQQILNHALSHEVQHVIFTSSTGVYKNTGELAKEEGVLEPTRLSGKALLEAEKKIKAYRFDWTILRLSGLVGGDRQPGRWFAGRTNLPGGDTPVNMVHRDDCIAAIIKIIESANKSDVYNICADKHPVKRDFYKVQSEKLGLRVPEFKKGRVDYKIVDNNKFKRDFGFLYKFSDPILF